MKERLHLDWIYAKQHADFMFGMQVGLEDVWRVLTLNQKFLKTDNVLMNFAVPFINLGNIMVYLLTWGLMFISCLLLAPSINVSLFADMVEGEDEVMEDFLMDAITANQQGFIDRFVMSALLLLFVGVSLLCAVFLFFVELILSFAGQEMYMADEH